jgi:hypothetical protein
LDCRDLVHRRRSAGAEKLAQVAKPTPKVERVNDIPVNRKSVPRQVHLSEVPQSSSSNDNDGVVQASSSDLVVQIHALIDDPRKSQPRTSSAVMPPPRGANTKQTAEAAHLGRARFCMNGPSAETVVSTRNGRLRNGKSWAVPVAAVERDEQESGHRDQKMKSKKFRLLRTAFHAKAAK